MGLRVIILFFILCFISYFTQSKYDNIVGSINGRSYRLQKVCDSAHYERQFITSEIICDSYHYDTMWIKKY